MKRIIAAFVVLFTSIIGSNAYAAFSPWVESDQAKIRIIAANINQDAGKAILHAGIELQLKDGWKTYWRTPGDVGMAPAFLWEGSSNIGDVAIKWPVPQRHIEVGGLQDFVYGDALILPVTTALIDSAKAATLNLSLRYLVCKDLCIPLDAVVSLTVPPAHQDAEAEKLLSKSELLVPQANGKNGLLLQSYRLLPGKGSALLEIKASSEKKWDMPDILVEGVEGLRFPKPSVTLSDAHHATFSIPVEISAKKDALENSLLHLTLINDRNQAVELEIPAVFTPSFQPLSAVQEGEVAYNSTSLFLIVLIALAGGLILNIMPCVLPVLSIKLLSIIRHGGADKKQIRANFLASSLGVIVSFMIIGGGLILLKSLGHVVGFGFQFQEPVFLIALVLVLVLFACNLWGIYEIHLPHAVGGFANSKIDNAHNSLVAHFLTGAFATVLATPCSAPFVGTAISFALSHGPLDILLIFTAMGIGLAAPYLVLSLFPHLVKKLPKPGAWMGKARFILGVALLITAFWLIWVVSQQLGMNAGIALFLLCMLLKFALEKRTSILRFPWVRAVFVVFIIVVSFMIPLRSYEMNKVQAQMVQNVWQPFDEQAIEKHVRAGKIVVVDVTADWCLTCKVNKLTLHSMAVLAYLRQPDVVAMRADITSYNAGVTAYLKSFGRYGIPFNAVYGPAHPEGIALSELPSKKELVGAILRARGQQKE